VNAIREAYSAGAEAWADGPSRVYGRLAEVLVDHMPVRPGMAVVDLGAGTGVLSGALAAAGACPIACDFAWAMLAHDRTHRPPAVTADARRLPLRDGAVDGVGAAFCLNHLDDPEVALREMGRVCAGGGFVVSATYASTSGHPAKAAVDTAAAELGFMPPSWYREVKTSYETLTDEVGKVEAVARRAGLRDVTVHEQSVDVGVDQPELLVGWRLGMASLAAFERSLDDDRRAALRARALELLGPDPEPYRPRVIVLVANAAS
jgi:SAM-dependent methyltransferase